MLAGEAQAPVLLAMMKEHALVTLQHGAGHVLGAQNAAFGQPVNEAPDVKPVVVNGARRVIARLHPAAMFSSSSFMGMIYDATKMGGGVQMCEPVRPPGCT